MAHGARVRPVRVGLVGSRCARAQFAGKVLAPPSERRPARAHVHALCMLFAARRTLPLIVMRHDGVAVNLPARKFDGRGRGEKRSAACHLCTHDPFRHRDTCLLAEVRAFVHTSRKMPLALAQSRAAHPAGASGARRPQQPYPVHTHTTLITAISKFKTAQYFGALRACELPPTFSPTRKSLGRARLTLALALQPPTTAGASAATAATAGSAATGAAACSTTRRRG